MTQKKQYEAPQLEVEAIDAASIICTSSMSGPSGANSSSHQTETLTEEVFTW